MVIRSTLFCLLIRRITHVLFKTIIMYEYFEIRGPVGPGREISEDINIGLFIALRGRGGEIRRGRGRIVDVCLC